MHKAILIATVIQSMMPGSQYGSQDPKLYYNPSAYNNFDSQYGAYKQRARCRKINNVPVGHTYYCQTNIGKRQR